MIVCDVAVDLDTFPHGMVSLNVHMIITSVDFINSNLIARIYVVVSMVMNPITLTYLLR
jgi:hypothetical protein